MELIQSFEVDAKIVKRKKYYVVYVKEGAQIVELLGIMGAGVSLMNLENVRIRDTAGLHSLPENLEETALLRLEYPQASLKELGALLSTPVGKSGMNHRLRKICSIANELRGVREEQV